MEIQPYSIYVKNRPYRIAFLVNPTGNSRWLDSIFEYNREKWGGRFNPIILTDGETIQSQWWKFLNQFDPDIILSTVPLSEELQRQITIFLSPLSIINVDPIDGYIDISEDPISILPTKSVRSFISRDFFDTESSLVLFKIEKDTPPIITEFLSKNFGIWEDSERTVYHLKRCLESCPKKVYAINDLESLNEALLDLGEFHSRVIFPAQICAAYDSPKDVEYNADNEKFTLIVGDTVEEMTYLWNRTLCIADWMRTRITQLWIPKALIEEQIILPGLSKFINRYTDVSSNENSKGVHFVTFSLSQEEIESILKKFTSVLRHSRKATKYTEPQIPNFGEYHSYFSLKPGLDFFRAHSEEEHLILNEPEIEEGGTGGQHWFVDLTIQFRPERFKNFIGKDYWWRLPKRNNLLSDLNFFNKPARINQRGTFSIQMRRKTTHSPNENTVIIKLPTDRAIFTALTCGESYNCIATDNKTRFLSRPFDVINKSDKGMYLSGVLSLFPSLVEASRFLEERYWRKLFEKMSNQSSTKDANQVQIIQSTLQKSIDRGRDFTRPEDVTWLAEKVLSIAKSYSKQEIDLPFVKFAELGQQETDEFNTKNPTNIIPFDPDGLKDDTSQLVAWNVLLTGIKPKCGRCGFRIWYHIDETHQRMVCKGCGYQFSIDTEENWHYRLNSLVRSAFSLHGTIPVLLVLGELISDSRSSFMYIPSINLFKRESKDNYDLVSELDLICIQDGKFIIGEIKQSVSLFTRNDFTKILEIAKVLKPDKIIFSSMDVETNSQVKENIKRLQSELAYLEITVEWYQISRYAFEPSPVR